MPIEEGEKIKWSEELQAWLKDHTEIILVTERTWKKIESDKAIDDDSWKEFFNEQREAGSTICDTSELFGELSYTNPIHNETGSMILDSSSLFEEEDEEKDEIKDGEDIYTDGDRSYIDRIHHDAHRQLFFCINAEKECLYVLKPAKMTPTQEGNVNSIAGEVKRYKEEHLSLWVCSQDLIFVSPSLSYCINDMEANEWDAFFELQFDKPRFFVSKYDLASTLGMKEDVYNTPFAKAMIALGHGFWTQTGEALLVNRNRQLCYTINRQATSGELSVTLVDSQPIQAYVPPTRKEIRVQFEESVKSVRERQPSASETPLNAIHSSDGLQLEMINLSQVQINIFLLTGLVAMGMDDDRKLYSLEPYVPDLISGLYSDEKVDRREELRSTLEQAILQEQKTLCSCFFPWRRSGGRGNLSLQEIFDRSFDWENLVLQLVVFSISRCADHTNISNWPLIVKQGSSKPLCFYWAVDTECESLILDPKMVDSSSLWVRINNQALMIFDLYLGFGHEQLTEEQKDWVTENIRAVDVRDVFAQIEGRLSSMISSLEPDDKGNTHLGSSEISEMKSSSIELTSSYCQLPSSMFDGQRSGIDIPLDAPHFTALDTINASLLIKAEEWLENLPEYRQALQPNSYSCLPW